MTTEASAPAPVPAPASRPPVTRRRALQDVALQVGTRVANVVLGIVVTALVVRTLGDAGYGQWTTIMALYSIVGYFASFGMETVAVREAAARPDEATDWVSALVVTRLMLSLPVMLAGLVVLLVIQTSSAMVVAGVVLLAEFPLAAASSMMIVHQLRVSNGLPMIVLTVNSVVWGAAVVVIHLLGGGLVALAIAMTLSTVLSATMQAVAAIRIVGFRLRPSRAAMRRLLRTGTTVGVASMLVLAYGSIDQLIVFQQAGSVAAGMYGAAYRIMVQAHLVPDALMVTLAPVIAASWPHDRTRMLRIVRLAAELLAIASLGGLAFSLVASRPVITLIFGEEFAPAARAMPVLAGAFVLMCVSYLTTNLLLVVGQTRRQVVAAVFGLIVNLAGNLALVPRYGFIAAAWMTLVTEGVVVAICMVYVCRALGLSRPPLGRSYRVAAAAAVLAGALELLDIAGAPLGVLCVVTVVLYPALLFAVRAVDREELLSVLRRRAGAPAPA